MLTGRFSMRFRKAVDPQPATTPQSPSVERSSLVGQLAPALSGLRPSGEAAAPEPAEGLVVFVTSTCVECQGLWSALGRHEGLSLRSATGVILVTPDPTLEDRRKVARLAPAGVEVRMSSDAWIAYGVRGAPWAAYVLDGVIDAEGPATSVEALVSLLRSGSAAPGERRSPP